MSKQDNQIIQQAIAERMYIQSLENKLENPLISREKAQEISNNLDNANIYHIQEAYKRGLSI